MMYPIPGYKSVFRSCLPNWCASNSSPLVPGSINAPEQPLLTQEEQRATNTLRMNRCFCGLAIAAPITEVMSTGIGAAVALKVGAPLAVGLGVGAAVPVAAVAVCACAGLAYFGCEQLCVYCGCCQRCGGRRS